VKPGGNGADGREHGNGRGTAGGTLPGLSIVIVSYNTREILRQCLRSIFHQEQGVEFEVIVVDNGSRDQSPAMVRKEFRSARLIENPHNQGFSVANNQAFPLCRFDRILLLNSDTIVLPGTLSHMVEFLEEHHEAGIVGCKLVKPDGDMDLACRRSFPTPLVALYKFVGLQRMFPVSRRFARYNLTYLDPNRTYEVDSIVGAFMLIRRELLERVGGLDEGFFMYGEDLDWCRRARAAAFKVYYVGEHQIVHLKGASSKKESFRMNWHFHHAMYHFHRKHFTPRYHPLVNWIVYGGIWLRFSALVCNHYLQGARRRLREWYSSGARATRVGIERPAPRFEELPE